jgi:2-oxoisovalerate dehydrogenase E1 component alpha subunit
MIARSGSRSESGERGSVARRGGGREGPSAWSESGSVEPDVAATLDLEGDIRRVLPIGGPAGAEHAPAAGEVDVEPGRLREMYRLMALTRRADLEATALQRQGQLAVYPPLIGQEAAQVGSAFALQRDEWIFPSYRELGAAVVRGIDLTEYLEFYRGTWHGGGWDPVEKRFGMVSVPVGSQTLHAVGYALGARMDGRHEATLVYFGDGATSEGDVHEACNMAAVFRAGVVFLCQNNQWAISVPLAKQTAAPIWRKAAAYGFPGVRVDGNDVLAVYQATREAAERARSNGTPTLIEAVTYRIGPHSTADDASRYRSGGEVDAWSKRDPLERYRAWLTATGVGDDAFLAEVEREADAMAARLRDGVVGSAPRPVEDLFRWVYADVPPHLARQRADALGENPASGSGGGGRGADG